MVQVTPYVQVLSYYLMKLLSQKLIDLISTITKALYKVFY